MQNVAAAWLMTSLTTSAVLVALLTTMSNLPLFLVGLPAGALADIVDRRWLVLVTQIWMMLVATVLGVMALPGMVTPWMLLILTFLLSLGGALSAPAWQAIVPDLVPRQELATAVALNSAGFNLARAIGPAAGGLLVAAAGPAWVFLLNAISFLGIMIVIYSWRPAPREASVQPERVMSAVVAGMRFTRYSPRLRAVLVRTAASIFSGSALWALLPVLATHDLGLDALGYGVMLASIGLGAVGGAMALPRLRAYVSINWMVALFSVIYALGLCVLALERNLIVLNIALMFMGVAWLTINSFLNVSAQMSAPPWVQARALGVYLLVSQGGLAGGSALWGYIAERMNTPAAFLIAAATLVVGAATVWRWPLHADDTIDLRPSQHWPAPHLAFELAGDEGPVLVLVAYRVARAQQAAFREAMQQIRQVRLRDGAKHWQLFRDTADAERLVECFVAPSWAEHLRQHERVTVADREFEERVAALLVPDAPTQIEHLVSVRAHLPLPQRRRDPRPAFERAGDEGPALVMLAYRVAEEQQPEFYQAMQHVQDLRLQQGARAWNLFRDTADAERIVETFFVAGGPQRQPAPAAAPGWLPAAQELHSLMPGAAPQVTQLLLADGGPQKP